LLEASRCGKNAKKSIKSFDSRVVKGRVLAVASRKLQATTRQNSQRKLLTAAAATIYIGCETNEALRSRVQEMHSALGFLFPGSKIGNPKKQKILGWQHPLLIEN